MKRIRDYTGKVEVNYYTFSSAAATPEEAIDTLTLETCGPYLGPDDFYNEIADEAIAYLSAHWNEAEEMPDADANEYISTLAECWNLSADELAYLK